MVHWASNNTMNTLELEQREEGIHKKFVVKIEAIGCLGTYS
jgi:hypothetical protein